MGVTADRSGSGSGWRPCHARNPVVVRFHFDLMGLHVLQKHFDKAAATYTSDRLMGMAFPELCRPPECGKIPPAPKSRFRREITHLLRKGGVLEVHQLEVHQLVVKGVKLVHPPSPPVLVHPPSPPVGPLYRIRLISLIHVPHGGAVAVV